MSLNPPQLEAVKTLSGPLLVLAGAGTGKTRVVTYRIAELIRHRTSPDRILAVTFTNKAADEMQERAGHCCGKGTRSCPSSRRSPPSTRSASASCGGTSPTSAIRPAFAIYDRGDQESVARTALREIKVADGLLRPGDLLYLIGRWKNDLDPARGGGRAGPDRQGAPGRVGLSPLSEGPARRPAPSISTTCCC